VCKTIGKRKKYSITLVFDSSLDSSHISTRIKFSDCCLQSSQIWRRCQNFRFEVFLVDSRMPTCHGISKAWCDVYLISVIALFARWVSSRWLYLWSLNHVGITLKPSWTLWINLWILQLLWLIKKAYDHIILSHYSAMQIVTLISSSLLTLDS
jgi:hypothetical protein